MAKWEALRKEREGAGVNNATLPDTAPVLGALACAKEGSDERTPLQLEKGDDSEKEE